MATTDAPETAQPPVRRRRPWAALIVLFILGGCTSAVVIPNLLTAMQRSKQKRTMADIRTLATAVEGRATDFNDYPAVRTIDELAPLVEPTYVKKMPRIDGWGNAFRYEAWKEPGDKVATVYGFRSSGRDGRFEKSSAREYASGATTNFDRDIVYSNGSFIQYPEGPA